MSKIIFKPAPRTKWRFVSGPVIEHLYTQLGLWDAAEVDDEALDCLLDDLSDEANDEGSFDEEEFEEEVD